MVKKKIIFFLLTLMLLCTGCTENAASIDENTDQVNESIDMTDNKSTDMIKEDKSVIPENTVNAGSVEDYDITAANNAFAFNMYSQMTKSEAGKYENIFFSPNSVSTAMAICYEGAENTTEEQISNVFFISPPIKQY